MIRLEPISHTYSNDLFPNVRYTSVTTVLGTYRHPFDEEYHSKRVAERRGVTPESVIAEWRELNRLANEYGTNLHEILERFLLAPKRLYSVRDEFEQQVIGAFRDVCFMRNLTLLNSETIKPEYIMSIEYDEEHGIAGTADIIEDLPNNMFNVWDFKTNKAFNYFNKYGEFLKFPVEHLSECQYNDYALQLSIYAVMYERETGKKFNRAGLFYWDKNIENFELIPIPYMKKDAEMILTHYKLTLK